MTVNASACWLKILIGADQQDWSAALKSFDVGVPKRDRGGLLPVTGTLTLTYWDYAPESMNPRLNPLRWFRGQVIKVQASLNGVTYTTHPCGKLYITKEPLPPHPDEQDLVLQVGCLLALRDFAEPDNDKSGVILGTATTRTTAVTSILAAANITTIIGTIPDYPIAHPLPKIGGSYVQQAGKVAFAGFKALWQDNSGNIQAIELRTNTGATPVVDIAIGVGGGEIVYKPSEGAETPVEELRCVGLDKIGIDTWRCLDSNPNESYQTSVNAGVASTRIIRRKTITDCQGLDGSGNFYKSREEFVEELSGSVYAVEEPGGQRLTWSQTDTTYYLYEPGVTGRLLYTLKTVVRPLEAAVASWWANLSPTQRLSYSYTSPTTASDTKTTYNYQDYPTPQDGSVADQYAFNYQAQVVASQTTLTKTPIAAIAPNEDLSSISNPLALEPSSVTTETWQKVRGYEWQKETITQAPLITADAEGAALASGIFSKIALVTTDDTTDVSASGGQQPPAPERRPDRYTEIEIQIKGRAFFGIPAGSSEQKRSRTIEVEYMVSNDQAAAIAQMEGALLIGRRQGQTILVPFDARFLSGFTPLQVWHCTEPDGTTYIYQADAIHFSHDPDKAVVGCEGIWLATIPVGTTTVKLPYNAIAPFDGGLLLGGSMRVFPYSLAPITAAMLGGLRMGGKLTPITVVNMRGGLRIGGLLDGKLARRIGGGLRMGGRITPAGIRQNFRGGLRMGGRFVGTTTIDLTTQWVNNLTAGGGSASTATINATRTFVNTLQASGTLAKLNLIWHFSGNYAASPYLLKYPSGHPGVVVYHGFSSSQYSETTGLSATAGTEYADLQYIPSTYQASNLRGSMIGYRHDSGTVPGVIMGVVSPNGGEFDLYPRFVDGNAYFSCYSGSNRIATSSSDGSGLFIGNRNADNYLELTRNGSLLASITTPGSNPLPNTDLFAYANNYNDGSTTGIFGAVQRLSFLAIGEGLTSGDVSTINSAYATYAAAIGRSLP